ncbi:MAG: hypothetical protein M3Q05_03620, partial [Bacteroidota bacterium]|nr:hypothetical protein [Bacteroidota bacterium]
MVISTSIYLFHFLLIKGSIGGMHIPEYFLPALLILIVMAGLYALYRERSLRYKPYYKQKNTLFPSDSYPKQAPRHAICLIGDTGNITDPVNDPIVKLLRTWLTENQENGTLIFLGDNIYPVG